MQFVSLKAFKTLGSRATSLGRRRRRHGSGAPALQRGGDRQLRGHRATAAVSPLLKEVNGCRGHSVVRGLGLKPLWIKRLVRIHRASRPVIAAAPVSRRGNGVSPAQKRSVRAMTRKIATASGDGKRLQRPSPRWGVTGKRSSLSYLREREIMLGKVGTASRSLVGSTKPIS